MRAAHGCFGDGGYYPDPDIYVIPGQIVWLDAVETQTVPPGNSDWQIYESPLYKVTNPDILSGNPIVFSNTNTGTLYFDDFRIEEFDQNGKLVRDLLVLDLEDKDPLDVIKVTEAQPFKSYIDSWIPWKADGESGTHELTAEAHGGSHSLAIRGVSTAYSLSFSRLQFNVRTGYSYKISGWIKGEEVSDQSGGMGIEFFGAAPFVNPVPFDKAYLEGCIQKFVAFGQANYVLYHGPDFGVYGNLSGNLPDPACANQPLIDLFTQLLISDIAIRKSFGRLEAGSTGGSRRSIALSPARCLWSGKANSQIYSFSLATQASIIFSRRISGTGPFLNTVS